MTTTKQRLDTTAYLVLGYLAIRPWSTYELATQMRRAVHYFWPAAERRLYKEPKRLVSAGLAEARTEYTGRRARTIYSITPTGRQLLEEWLEEPVSESRLEAEILVKLSLAPYGSKQALVENLHEFRRQVEEKRTHIAAVLDGYIRDDKPFPERLHVNTLLYGLLWEHTQADARWADWALAISEEWPDVDAPEDAAQLKQILAEMVGESP